MKPVYDVIVIGGGTAGVTAAVQAGRAGASTLLVEKNAMLGDTMTIGGINYPAHFFTDGRQIVGGIGWELLCKTYAETGQPVPKPSEGTRHVWIDAAIFAAVADEAVLAAGVDILFHAMPATVNFVAGRCLASDRDANSALRVECPCLAMGQAAGGMAALSARTGMDPTTDDACDATG